MTTDTQAREGTMLAGDSRESVGLPRPSVIQRLRANRLNIFHAVQIIAALAILVFETPRIEGNLAIFALLMALVFFEDLVPINIYGDSNISAGWVYTLAIIMLFGPAGAAISAPIEALATTEKRKVDLRVVTNGARFTIVYWLSALAYQAIAPVNPASFEVLIIAGSAAATALCFILSALFIAVTLNIRTGEPIGAMWSKHSWIAVHYLAMGIVGIALAAAYVALGIVGIVAFVTPALMMRFAMKQYVDKTAENVEKLQEQNEALQVANVQITMAREDLAESYDGTLEALVNALDARDQETKGHSVRVQHYMLKIAKVMGVVEGTNEWTDMSRGSLLHDVGKIGVSDTILLKPGKLDPAEWELMRRHPEIGYNMLRQVKFLQGAANLVLAHHERWDGKGYPKGLAGDEIPLGSRIFSVVDTFDSMTSDRPYRRALTTMEALNEILKHSSTQFDPLVVEAFLDIYDTWVKDWGELHKDEDYNDRLITVERSAA